MELKNNPHGVDGHGGDGSLAAAPIEKITEEDFGDLEEMSKAANKLAFENPAPPEPEAVAPPAAAAPALEIPELPELSDSPPMAMNETGPGESPDASASNAMPSFMDDNVGGDSVPGEQPAGMDLPSHSQMAQHSNEDIPGIEGVPGGDLAMDHGNHGSGQADAIPLSAAVGAAHISMSVSERPPSSAHDSPEASDSGDSPEMVLSEPFASETTAAVQHASHSSHSSIDATIDTESPTRAHAQPGLAPAPTPKSQLDPNRLVVNAAPAGISHTRKSGAPAAAKQDMSALKKFADKLSIGKPNIEGAPAFSMLATNANGYFDEKTIKAIENAITSEDFGIRVEDVAVQLSAGKLLVPQISEFAAITLAQKLRDVVDNIELDLASEIFKGSAAELGSMDESILMDAEEFETHHEEVHDMGAEPRNENDIFTTNLPELSEFQITRILSIVMCSEIMPADIAENPTTKEFEAATERLTEELVKRAFKLGAHGVLGINFTLKSIEAFKDTAGKVRRAYRMIGTGTAVRARKR